ncbi:MAG: hypothetical protein K2M17_01625 [Bacilli bacterium]|nr:hypothetical protein [Bacilli bacterium]
MTKAYNIANNYVTKWLVKYVRAVVGKIIIKNDKSQCGKLMEVVSPLIWTNIVSV